MARKVSSRLSKRREAEAADARPAAAKKTKGATAKKATTRKKTKAPERKRLIWGVFSGTMKEEARFPYDQRAAAEERLEQLRSKGKKMYFIQPIKELVTAATSAAAAPGAADAAEAEE
ncbi:hypothetical protein Pan44_13560 [Caulifigura coniformis]|uniref:Uncharacterized protein n=1 Tax=Caulifigura coniformis TaxID=2527983 RepID=A0A517SB50_9PLAN|nr:hypothetical protein [Caulifigura coniformis]QDT53339.1 hypothetical protein Pan44_13560 [Caulifigura coniformis]